MAPKYLFTKVGLDCVCMSCTLKFWNCGGPGRLGVSMWTGCLIITSTPVVFLCCTVQWLWGPNIKQSLTLSNITEPCKDTEEEDQKLMVVSYPSYCRYHGNLKRIEKQGDKWRSNPLLKALGLLSMPHPHTKLLFCRDEFDHPIMEEDERLCEYTGRCTCM